MSDDRISVRVVAATESGSRLIGREPEMARISAALADPVAGISMPLIIGQPGIGKSSMLSYAANHARAAGMQVLMTTGVEIESHAAFAGLHQLLRPVVDRAAHLPAPYRDAIYSALGLSSGHIPEPFIAGMATLELVCSIAMTSPVLLVVDDVQWIDSATLECLAVVARRLSDDPVTLVAACREGYHSALHDIGLDELRLGGLDDVASQTLLDDIVPELEQVRRAQVLGLSAGNPLALVELSRSGHDLGAESVPVTGRIERAFAGRLSDLPANASALVLMAALDNSESVQEILDAAALFARQPVTLADLTPAVAARLVIVDGPRLTFPHPLARSAVQQAASLDDRLAAHSAWAHVKQDNPDLAVWHLAAATLGTDDILAAELDAAARRARLRGAPTSAQAAHERAAEMSSDPLRRAERLLDAAEIAYELGRRDTVERLLQLATSLDPRPMSLVRAMWIRERFDDGLSRSTVGVPALAEAALDAHHDGNRELALNLLARAAIRCWWTKPVGQERHAVLGAIDTIGSSGAEPQLIAAIGWVASIERESELRRLLETRSGTHLYAEECQLLAAAAICLGDQLLAGRYLDAAVEGLRRDGRIAWLAQSLIFRAWNSIHLMHLDIAIADATEGRRLADESAQPFWTARADCALATIAGIRGDVELAAELADAAERTVYPRGISSGVSDVQFARGVTALSNRDYQVAFEQLGRMFASDDAAFHFVKRCWSIGDFAEAAVRTGHRDAAVDVLRDLIASVGTTSSPHIVASLRHATAVLADDATADTSFREALDATGREEPYERARLQLAYGTWLRRRRRVAECREPLRLALATFDALGAISWGQQARDELRASGETARGRTPDALDQLTPQELQIARLVAEGLPNREIGQRLYLSPRTIGSHLYRIFPKLGVTARSQLAGKLDLIDLRRQG
jgi:DNA-binding CsgD family transcriptional regulator